MGSKELTRGSGVLLAITSLPSSYGIGTLGEAAFQFVDLLVDLKQRYWQVLPIGPTSFGNSPYQSYSAFAGNPYLIDLDDLVKDGWAHREMFLLGPDGRPNVVAGAAPDAFSESGQVWGSPVYDWNVMEEDGFAWWKARMLENMELFDVIRLDHFSGLVRYYTVSADAEDGRNGKWSKGPGRKLTDAMTEVLGDTRVIVEDIGPKGGLPGVKKLKTKTGWPGIKILMFAFDDDTANEHLPHNYQDMNMVVYTGTHDNETIVGYFRDKSDYELAYLYEYLSIHYKEEIPDALIRAAYASIADVAIIQMQDLMKLGNEARMNAPSTVGRNWRWRIGKDTLSEERRAWIRTLAAVYRR